MKVGEGQIDPPWATFKIPAIYQNTTFKIPDLSGLRYENFLFLP